MTYDGNAQVSFAKIGTDSWGIRVALRHKSGRHPSPGDEVIVRKRDGSSERVTLGALVSQDRGAFPGPANYYKIARKPGAGARRSRARSGNYRPNPTADQDKLALEESGRAAREEWERAQRALADYDPADFEYFDGETEIQEAHEERLRRRVQETHQLYLDLRETYRRRYCSPRYAHEGR